VSPQWPAERNSLELVGICCVFLEQVLYSHGFVLSMQHLMVGTWTSAGVLFTIGQVSPGDRDGLVLCRCFAYTDWFLWQVLLLSYGLVLCHKLWSCGRCFAYTVWSFGRCFTHIFCCSDATGSHWQEYMRVTVQVPEYRYKNPCEKWQFVQIAHRPFQAPKLRQYIIT